MKRLIFSLIYILSIFVLGAAAQTSIVRQNYESGVKSAHDGEFKTALVQFQTSLDAAERGQTDDFFRAKIHFNIGVCLYQLKNQASAVPQFERAIALDSDYEKAFYALGMAQFELKNWRESENAFRGAIRLNEKNGENWFDLAFVYLAQNDLDSAKTAFQKSIRLKSVASAFAHNNLGVIFALQGDPKTAVKEFETALDKTGGKLTIAADNLRFCKTPRRNHQTIAALEFGK